jgi:methylated-DNA-[protein]-cysteine S-methyltransferase
MPSPLGPLVLHGRDGRLAAIEMRAAAEPADDGSLAEARRQLEAYFAGERRTFDLDLDLAGTAFDRRVWEAVRAIPYGTTASYGQLAARLGVPRAARAVGHANGRNPLPIVIPCHRLVGADGSLTGYRYGTERKRALLEHEASHGPQRTYMLLGADRVPYASGLPGTLGGHRRSRVYGRLDCPGALRWIARGHYVRQRVFFADEATAIAAGYRPCARCLPAAYRCWVERSGRDAGVAPGHALDGAQKRLRERARIGVDDLGSAPPPTGPLRRGGTVDDRPGS